jgi:precorrin-2 dehydrogenase/sirohydrochlorin ferrochelatase
MNFYPAFLDLRGRPCLIAGGGAVAERKALSLFDAGADLTVVSPQLTPVLQELSRKNKIMHRQRPYEEQDLAGMYLAVAATNDTVVNAAVARDCRRLGILVNSATSPDDSSFIVPSVVERGNLLIAVSTCGSSPALARKVREDLERTYGPEYGLFLEKMALLRRKLLHEVADEGMRRRVFQALVDSDVLFLLKGGADHEADLRIADIVKAVAGRP